MNEAAVAPAGDKDVVSVFLTCVLCGSVEEIHVFRERKLPRKVYWECLGCQNGKAGNASRTAHGGPGGAR